MCAAGAFFVVKNDAPRKKCIFPILVRAAGAFFFGKKRRSQKKKYFPLPENVGFFRKKGGIVGPGQWDIGTGTFGDSGPGYEGQGPGPADGRADGRTGRAEAAAPRRGGRFQLPAGAVFFDHP